jgi:rRNA maturation protein Nop10
MRGYAIHHEAGRADSVDCTTQNGRTVMNGSYRQCVQCGKRALNFATRCPGCGVALPDPAPFTPDDRSVLLGWSHSIKGIAVVLAIGGAIVGTERVAQNTSPLRAETGSVAEGRKGGRAKAPEDTVIVEATAAATVAPPAPAAAPAPVTLVAQSWINVRSRRLKTSELEAMLEPGDTVTADSLVAGYYHVAMYGEVLGWAKEANLARTTP